MKFPPIGSSVRVVWQDASSDPRGWKYSGTGPIHESEERLNYLTEGTYLGIDEGRACVAPSVVVDKEDNVVAAGDRWWIPVGCIESIYKSNFRVFSKRTARKRRKDKHG